MQRKECRTCPDCWGQRKSARGRMALWEVAALPSLRAACASDPEPHFFQDFLLHFLSQVEMPWDSVVAYVLAVYPSPSVRFSSRTATQNCTENLGRTRASEREKNTGRSRKSQGHFGWTVRIGDCHKKKMRSAMQHFTANLLPVTRTHFLPLKIVYGRCVALKNRFLGSHFTAKIAARTDTPLVNKR